MSGAVSLLPSAARTLRLPVPGAGVMAGVTMRPAPLMWSAKAASDVLDYSLDCSSWLADCVDTIDKIAIDLVSAAPATDLAIQWAIFQNGVVTLALAGGQPLLRYLLRITVTTTQGRSIAAICTLPVSSVDTAPGTATLTKPALAIPAGSVTINGTPNT